MTIAEPNSCWYRLTPFWLIAGLLAAEPLLCRRQCV
jgi:hypothetical protein